MEACGVSQATVYRWISSEITPDKLQQEAIARITGKTVVELFPDEIKEKML